MSLLYILYGEDEFSISEALGKIKKGVGEREMLDVNTTTLDARDLSLNQLKQVCESVPFLAEKRLVIVEGLLTRFEPKDKSPRRGMMTATELAECQQISECLGHLPESTILVLLDVFKIRESNPLLKLIATKGEVHSFPLKRGLELQRWVEEHIAKEGGRISPTASKLMAGLVGGNLLNMSNEIKKLILFTAGRPITEQDIKMVVSEAQEASIFVMIDAAFEGKVGQAEQILQQLLERGATPGNILTMLSRQVRIIVLTRELKGQGKSTAEIREKLRITQEFVWQKIVRQIDKYSMEQLKLMYRKLLETDIAIKTGKYDEEIALNMLLAELGEQSNR